MFLRTLDLIFQFQASRIYKNQHRRFVRKRQNYIRLLISASHAGIKAHTKGYSLVLKLKDILFLSIATLHKEPLRSVVDNNPCSYLLQLVSLVSKHALLTSLTFLELGCPPNTYFLSVQEVVLLHAGRKSSPRVASRPQHPASYLNPSSFSARSFNSQRRILPVYYMIRQPRTHNQRVREQYRLTAFLGILFVNEIPPVN